ncbi:hypothetical protein [Pandoravirus japonicus]|uniref:Transmembrane protein n=1 Tax=Pandoravirus japonicus TaxID=2823154 RepID=A0A811BLB5_9VIRU|nr:hypothetical protein [Pandoravirus japonicus]
MASQIGGSCLNLSEVRLPIGCRVRPRHEAKHASTVAADARSVFPILGLFFSAIFFLRKRRDRHPDTSFFFINVSMPSVARAVWSSRRAPRDPTAHRFFGPRTGLAARPSLGVGRVSFFPSFFSPSVLAPEKQKVQSRKVPCKMPARPEPPTDCRRAQSPTTPISSHHTGSKNEN